MTRLIFYFLSGIVACTASDHDMRRVREPSSPRQGWLEYLSGCTPGGLASQGLYSGYEVYGPPGESLQTGPVLSNGTRAYKLQGDPSLAPVIVFGGNCMSGIAAMQYFILGREPTPEDPGKGEFEGIWGADRGRYKIPTIYAMDYYKNHQVVDEKMLIKCGLELFSLAITDQEPGKPLQPHLFGTSLGCAVSVAVAHAVGQQVASLVLMYPFDNAPNTIETFTTTLVLQWFEQWDDWLWNYGSLIGSLVGTLVGKIAANCLRLWDNNTWCSDERIAELTQVPVCIFSGTFDTTIRASMHEALYSAALCGNKESQPFQDNSIRIRCTENRNRLFIQANRGHCEPMREFIPVEGIKRGEDDIGTFLKSYVLRSSELDKNVYETAVAAANNGGAYSWLCKKTWIFFIVCIPAVYYGYQWYFSGSKEGELDPSTQAEKKRWKGWIGDKYNQGKEWASKNQSTAWLIGAVSVLFGINSWNTCCHASEDEPVTPRSVMRNLIFPNKKNRKSKSGSGKMIGIVFMIILVVIAFGAIAFYLTRQQGPGMVYDIENPRPRAHHGGHDHYGGYDPRAERRRGYERFRRFQARHGGGRRYY